MTNFKFSTSKNTKSRKIDVGDRGLLLEKLNTALNLRSPVIVSPSMSGNYSVPFLFIDPQMYQSVPRDSYT